jgi:hypothetical protein
MTEDRSEEVNTWRTNDMSIAAWLRTKDVRIVKIEKNPERPKEFNFVFDDSKNSCDEIALEFLNSDAHKFDTAMRTLKKMCFGPSGIRGRVGQRRRR